MHSERKPASQVPSEGGDEHRQSAPGERVDGVAPGAEAQAASEPMSDAATLSRLDDGDPPGFPPAGNRAASHRRSELALMPECSTDLVLSYPYTRSPFDGAASVTSAPRT
jgi:hypothetical protein